MNKKLLLLVVEFILMSAMFIVGLVLIFSAPTIGARIGHRAIVRAGSMDGAAYVRIIESNTTAFNTAGLALTIVGGIGFIIGGNALFKELD